MTQIEKLNKLTGQEVQSFSFDFAKTAFIEAVESNEEVVGWQVGYTLTSDLANKFFVELLYRISDTQTNSIEVSDISESFCYATIINRCIEEGWLREEFVIALAKKDAEEQARFFDRELKAAKWTKLAKQIDELNADDSDADLSDIGAAAQSAFGWG